ncbi:MAG: class I SAM-dependent methyltransferase [Candidatus Bathyarchaeia archaeon]
MAEWNNILLRSEYAPEEPDAVVVETLKLLKRPKSLKVLDLGRGAGRHVVYLASRKLEAYGVDISNTGLIKTKERLEKSSLKAFLVRCDMKSLPFISSLFDVVICLNTIYHQKFRELQQTINEVWRILKGRGLFLVNFHPKRSYRYGTGIKVEENTFMDIDGPERSVLHHFVDEDELKLFFQRFRIIKKRLNERAAKGWLRSIWEILAEKP